MQDRYIQRPSPLSGKERCRLEQASLWLRLALHTMCRGHHHWHSAVGHLPIHHAAGQLDSGLWAQQALSHWTFASMGPQAQVPSQP